MKADFFSSDFPLLLYKLSGTEAWTNSSPWSIDQFRYNAFHFFKLNDHKFSWMLLKRIPCLKQQITVFQVFEVKIVSQKINQNC